MTESLKPFHLMRHEGGKSSFFFMADAFYHEPCMSLIQEKTGIDRDYFNGHAWAKIVNLLIQKEFADQAANIALDPEADMFSAISEDYELLVHVVDRFKAVLQNEGALKLLLEQLS